MKVNYDWQDRTKKVKRRGNREVNTGEVLTRPEDTYSNKELIQKFIRGEIKAPRKVSYSNRPDFYVPPERRTNTSAVDVVSELRENAVNDAIANEIKKRKEKGTSVSKDKKETEVNDVKDDKEEVNEGKTEG